MSVQCVQYNRIVCRLYGISRTFEESYNNVIVEMELDELVDEVERYRMIFIDYIRKILIYHISRTDKSVDEISNSLQNIFKGF